MVKHEGPVKAHREGVTLMQLTAMFPDGDAATAWFEALVWPNGRHCPRCGCADTREAAKTAGLPYYCIGCQKTFSVKIGTALERSKVTLRQWVFAIYLEMTSLKGVSSMKLHRDIGVTQKTAWFMLHRIREAWDGFQETFTGPVEADEACFDEVRANMPKAKHQELTGRGTVSKTAVAGVKDCETSCGVAAQVVPPTDGDTLQTFVRDHAAKDSVVYTDEHGVYAGQSTDYTHDTVHHSVGEYRGQVHTQGIESFWSMLKRAHKDGNHKLSAKHLHRYVRESTGRHNVRGLDTMDQLAKVSVDMVGKRLIYRQLITDNRFPSGTLS